MFAYLYYVHTEVGIFVYLFKKNIYSAHGINPPLLGCSNKILTGPKSQNLMINAQSVSSKKFYCFLCPG